MLENTATVVCSSLCSRADLKQRAAEQEAERCFLEGEHGGGSPGKLAPDFAPPSDLPAVSHCTRARRTNQWVPTRLSCAVTRSRVPGQGSLPEPLFLVNQGRWWFQLTYPDSGGLSAPAKWLLWDWVPKTFLTLTQNPLSSRLRTLPVPGDTEMCLCPLPLYSITHFATFICFHCR